MTLLLKAGRPRLLPMATKSPSSEWEDWAHSIRALNDAFRINFTSTELYCSPGILKFELPDQEVILGRVRFYRGFRKANDPDMLHNRGSFEYGGQKIVWEIYCADLEGQGESPNPANLNLTERHMMILLEEEWWTDLPNQTA